MQYVTLVNTVMTKDNDTSTEVSDTGDLAQIAGLSFVYKQSMYMTTEHYITDNTLHCSNAVHISIPFSKVLPL